MLASRVAGGLGTLSGPARGELWEACRGLSVGTVLLCPGGGDRE